MSITIYEKTPSGLYATGDRTVSTFPSGLVRVDQTFVCRTSAAATHRAALSIGSYMPGDRSPSIDDLSIFPAPQEITRGDGFTEFIVTAYGILHTNGTMKIEKKLGNIFGKKYKSDKITITTLRRNNDEIIYPTFQSNIVFFEGQINVYKYTNKTITFSTGVNTSASISAGLIFVIVSSGVLTAPENNGVSKLISIASSQLDLSSHQETNFGIWNEVTMVFEHPNLVVDQLATNDFAVTGGGTEQGT